MSDLLVGYARVSTAAQDLTAQRDGLAALGVDPDRVYVDHGLTGTNRARPGLREALAACRTGDTLVVTKLDRLARSVPDARDIVDEVTARGVRLNVGGSLQRPERPDRAAAVHCVVDDRRVRGRPRPGPHTRRPRRGQDQRPARGKQPKLKPTQEAHLVKLWRDGDHTTLELADRFSVSRATVYLAIQHGGRETKPTTKRSQNAAACRCDPRFCGAVGSLS